MIYILDNNVVSELFKPVPDSNVIEWLSTNDYLIPAPMVAEIQEGIDRVAKGSLANAVLD